MTPGRLAYETFMLTCGVSPAWHEVTLVGQAAWDAAATAVHAQNNAKLQQEINELRRILADLRHPAGQRAMFDTSKQEYCD